MKTICPTGESWRAFFLDTGYCRLPKVQPLTSVPQELWIDQALKVYKVDDETLPEWLASQGKAIASASDDDIYAYYLDRRYQ